LDFDTTRKKGAFQRILGGLRSERLISF